jgi:hypothetical protein
MHGVFGKPFGETGFLRAGSKADYEFTVYKKGWEGSTMTQSRKK